MKPKAYVTRRLPAAAMIRLAEVFELKVNPEERVLPYEELLAEIGNIEALICMLTDRMDKAAIDSAPRLKVISNYAVGYNNIDVEYATSKGIAVCNTPGVLTETTADLTWALIMATCRRITESEAYLRAGRFKAWEPMMMLGQDIYGKTLGILGMGRIGKAVAKRAAGFDMQIIWHDPTVEDADLPFATTRVSLATLLSESDILTLHSPLTPETTHLIGKEQFAQMKRTAVLINTARGAIVNEAELIVALRDKQIFAAGLDVYEHEPDLPPELLELSNVVLLPHIGSASIATRTKMGLLAAENAIATVQGKPAPARVN